MKKSLFIISMVVFASGLYADGFKLMGGLNLLKYSAAAEEGSFRWNQKLGLCMGGGFELGLNENQTISVEIDGFIVQKKGTRLEEGESSKEGLTYSLTTLLIPLLARVKAMESFPVYLLGGSEFSLVLSHSFEKGTGEDKKQWDIKELTKRFDIGVVLGGGFEVRMREFQNFFVEIRFHYGLLNMVGNYEEFSSLKTHALLFVVGLKTY